MWRKQWGYEVSAKPVRTGIWRLKTGGFLVACRVTDRRKKRRSRWRVLHDARTVIEAQRALDVLHEETRAMALGRARQTRRFAEFATSLYERKVAAGDLKSAATRELWDGVLCNQIIPRFGDFWCHDIRYADLVEWRDEALAPRLLLPKRIELSDENEPAKKRVVRNPKSLAPNTANGWFRILRVITKAMTAELELARDPAAGLKNFDVSTNPTYTAERPNSATPERARAFLAHLARLYPQHYAMVLLGFVTGQRPSSLRPLRSSGPEPDILWTESAILIRRSNSRTGEVMDGTKTGIRYRIELPESVMSVLTAHLETFEAGSKQAKSGLMFPSRKGGMMSRTSLYKPFAKAAAAAGIPFPLTPRAMRRTFQDLARKAGVPSIVKRAISGHSTEEMEEHYSTVSADEKALATTQISGLIHRAPEAVKKAVKPEEK